MHLQWGSSSRDPTQDMRIEGAFDEGTTVVITPQQGARQNAWYVCLPGLVGGGFEETEPCDLVGFEDGSLKCRTGNPFCNFPLVSWKNIRKMASYAISCSAVLRKENHILNL